MMMAEKKREKDPSSCSYSSSVSVSDALLFTTMFMVGLPVEVQVKDGSLYSGIFHTASLDNGYGVILKKARKIGKGRHETSLTLGSLIDTLVVFSDDLVQIAVKDNLLPVETFVGNLTGVGMEAATRKIESQDCMLNSERDPKPLIPGNNLPVGILNPNKERMSKYGPATKNTWFEESAARKVLLPSHLENTQVGDMRGLIGKVVENSVPQTVLLQERQVGKGMPQGEANSCYHMKEASEAKKIDQEVHCLSSNDVCPTQADSAGDRHGALTSNSNGTRSCTTSPLYVKQEDILDSMCLTSTSIPSSDVQTSTISSSSTLVLNSKTSSCPTLSESSNVRIYKKNSSCVTSAKEFKLNPGAKVFSPSPPNSRTLPTTLPTITRTGYMSNIPSVLPIAIAESGVEISSFATRAPVPAKVMHYNSLVNGTTGEPAQYARHVVGHAAAQQQPIRYSGHYHSLQAGPTYLHPSPQVMVGRTSQVVYVHPTAQDAFQGASGFRQGSSYPVLNQCQANMPKFQGAGGFQTFVTPSNVVPIPQPFSTIRTTLVPGGNGFFASKFP